MRKSNKYLPSQSYGFGVFCMDKFTGLRLTSPDVRKTVLFQATKQQLETQLLIFMMKQYVVRDLW